MRTKHFKIFLLAMAAVLAMAGCGDDDKKEPSPVNPVTSEGQTYRQSVTIDAQGGAANRDAHRPDEQDR